MITIQEKEGSRMKTKNYYITQIGVGESKEDKIEREINKKRSEIIEMLLNSFERNKSTQYNKNYEKNNNRP